MALTHLLLGLLEEPASGYDLGRRFEATVGVFWKAELSQVYATLHRLEDEGLAESHHAPPRGGPQRRVYERTERGRRELERWLREDPEPVRRRIPYLAQLFFLGQLGDRGRAARFLRHLRDQFRSERDQLLAVAGDEADVAATWDSDLSALTARMVLDAGLAANAARIAWCEASLGRLGHSAEAERQ